MILLPQRSLACGKPYGKLPSNRVVKRAHFGRENKGFAEALSPPPPVFPVTAESRQEFARGAIAATC